MGYLSIYSWDRNMQIFLFLVLMLRNQKAKVYEKEILKTKNHSNILNLNNH